MKVQLDQDILFEKKENVNNQLKQKQRQKLKRARSSRLDLSPIKQQLDIEVIDPLPEQLRKYKKQIEFKNTFDLSKASQILKKYVIQQQRNLKRIRLQKLEDDKNFVQKRGSLRIKIRDQVQEQKNGEQINIPKIQEEFKNQQKQYVLFESRLMRQRLKKASAMVDNGVNKIKSLTFKGINAGSISETRKNSTMDKYESIINPQSKDYKDARSDVYGLRKNLNNDLQEGEIDQIIEKKLKKSQQLRQKLYSQKKQMATMQAKQSTTKSLNFYIAPPKKQKKKIFLEGVKAISHKKGKQQIKVTPASILLFSLNQMSRGHRRKQSQLSQLIQNSYQNRSQTLNEKSNFYEQQTPFNDLSPSNQFKMRKLMQKKLMHRIQLSREQINKFVSYLSEIKNYHVILKEEILKILKQVRQILLTGKVMKVSDLSKIMQDVPRSILNQYPNNLIIHKLSQMMI